MSQVSKFAVAAIATVVSVAGGNSEGIAGATTASVQPRIQAGTGIMPDDLDVGLDGTIARSITHSNGTVIAQGGCNASCRTGEKANGGKKC
jgi:hypothetical protein